MGGLLNQRVGVPREQRAQHTGRPNIEPSASCNSFRQAQHEGMHNLSVSRQ